MRPPLGLKVMLTFFHRFDPRRHLAAAIGWGIALLSLLAALGSGYLVVNATNSDLEHDIGSLFASESSRIGDSIVTSLEQHMQWISASAAQTGAQDSADNPTEKLQALKILQNAQPDIQWIMQANRKGIISAGVGNFPKILDADQSQWFSGGQNAPYIGNADNKGAAPAAQQDDNAINIAAPVKSSEGVADGAIVARLGLGWLQKLEQSSEASLSKQHEVEVAVVTRDGRILAGNWREESEGLRTRIDHFNSLLAQATASQNDGYLVSDNYLMGFSRVMAPDAAAQLDWWVAIREPTATAFAPAKKASSNIFSTIMLSGLATALAMAGLSSLLLRRLSRIAQSADDLHLGRSQHFVASAGDDEIGRIGRSIATLINGLQSSNNALTVLNQDLDERVEERTKEVRRLYEETKVAAVTRERLRISRDLHDTLAHSMLAVLSQLRLIRKLERVKPELVSAELAEAERVAKAGLDLARNAVVQLRYQAVRDDGLGPALERLIKKLKERVVIEANLTIDDTIAEMASQKAETVYRIAEEAMHNIEKHADAHHVEMHISMNKDGVAGQLLMLIKDDGKGFVTGGKKNGHFGLVGMQEQADTIGGKLKISSTPGEGTAIQLIVPL